jgi:hypothetical protein
MIYAPNMPADVQTPRTRYPGPLLFLRTLVSETPEVMGQPTICFLLERLEFRALRVTFISHFELFLAAGAYLTSMSLDIVSLSSVLFFFGHLPNLGHI